MTNILSVAGQGAADGTPFGRYRLVELLGRGGMGEVWRAHDTETDRIVALKLLPPHLSEDADFQRRFRREAHAAARLNSPHVIPIHHYGEIDGRLYVDMRLIEGRDLETVLADGPLEPGRAVRIIDQVAKALHAAHKVGLLHRDVKPSNILLDRDDFAYLIDFGIARAVEETRMTKSGGYPPGTFQYIAPERLGTRPEEDARADIYSLACVLYESLTGRPPFAAETMAGLVAAHLNTPPPQPSATQPDLPKQIDEVIATGMAKDPDNRYATTVELADAARDAITVSIQRPTPSPAPNPPTEQAGTVTTPWSPHDEPPQPPPSRSDPTLAATVEQQDNKIAQESTQLGSTQPTGAPTTVPLPATTAPSARWFSLWFPMIFAIVGIGGIAIFSLIYSIRHPSSPKVPASYSSQVVLPFTNVNPEGVAVDTAGTVYLADFNNNRVLKLPAGSTTPVELPFTGLKDPKGVAVDTAGDVYVVDRGNNRVLKLPARSTTPVELPFTGLKGPDGVAVDTAGDVYVVDRGNNRVLKLPPG
jgi:serine/threonine protein kinase, bacterial